MHNKWLTYLKEALIVLAVIAMPLGRAWGATTEKALCVSPGEPNAYPRSNLVFDSAGNLYGTTGGFNGAPNAGTAIPNGTVFELVRRFGGGWTCKQIYAFQGGPNDGSVPLAGLVIDGAGNLYGTTNFGGSSDCGVVFEVSPGSGNIWREGVLYNFGPDGCGSAAALVFDDLGNLYGTNVEGGPGDGGTVFELVPNQVGGWTEKLLYGFSGADGHVPAAGVTFDHAGNLYGTTEAGGLHGLGTVFELTPTVDGWSETVLYSFEGDYNSNGDGEAPIGGVTFDASGNLWGTTNSGGDPPGCCGTVYELTPNVGGIWTESVIYRFHVNDGTEPRASVTFDPAGNLYSTTWGGGSGGHGTVFKLSRNPNNDWTQTELYSFTGGRDGGNPYASVIIDTAGHLYGTTYDGGLTGHGNGYGVAFEIP